MLSEERLIASRLHTLLPDGDGTCIRGLREIRSDDNCTQLFLLLAIDCLAAEDDRGDIVTGVLAVENLGMDAGKFIFIFILMAALFSRR